MEEAETNTMTNKALGSVLELVGWLSKVVPRCRSLTLNGLGRPSYRAPRTRLKQSLVFPATALALLAGLQQACAADSAKGETVPFLYSQDFESGADPVRFWTSYQKKHTVNFKGVTGEEAHSGKQSFKLDVTFDETSRFLWHIPMEKQVPVGGKLKFSGRLLLGEGTTGRATLGVSFRFPPTTHSGCTAPHEFYESTHGRWEAIEGDCVQRSRQVADNVTDRFTAGIREEHVGILLERIIFDLRGEAGQRVVLYVDDLQLRGDVPTEAAFRDEMARRWAPVKVAFDASISSWQGALDRAQAKLASLADLSKRADAMRREMLAEVRRLKAKLDTIKKRGFLAHSEQPAFDDSVRKLKGSADNIRAISDAELAGELAWISVVPAISGIRILPGNAFTCGRVSQTISLVAACGEYEPGSFVVFALSDIQSLSVAASDLRSDSGSIPGANVDVKLVKCWYQAGTAWVGIRQDKSKRLLTPELLLNDDTLVRVDHEKKENYLKLGFSEGEKYVWISDPTDAPTGKSLPVEKFPVKDSAVLLPVDIPAGTNRQFWVTLKVPPDVEPGTYVGKIALKTPDAAIGELTLKLNVLPFELLPPYYTSSMDYHGRLVVNGKGTISSWSKSRIQFRRELQNMVAHGLSNCQHYSIRKEILGEVLKIREEVGMDNQTLYLKNTIPIGRPTDPEALQSIQENVRDILDFTKDYGTKVVYFYGMDERRGEELTSQRPAWKAVREAGGKIFVAGWGDNIQMMGDIQDMHVRAGWPSKEEVAKWHALGHKIFCYANPQTGVENPVVYRRNYGLLLWKYEYDGASTNAYQHTFGATWNDFDHRTYRAHTIAYPTADGVIDTIAWEGYREGVDDVRYVTTLEKAIEAAKKSQDPTRKNSAGAAEDFLRRLKTGTDIETGDLDAIRQAIINRILDLKRFHAGRSDGSGVKFR